MKRIMALIAIVSGGILLADMLQYIHLSWSLWGILIWTFIVCFVGALPYDDNTVE